MKKRTLATAIVLFSAFRNEFFASSRLLRRYVSSSEPERHALLLPGVDSDKHRGSADLQIRLVKSASLYLEHEYSSDRLVKPFFTYKSLIQSLLEL